MRQTMQKPGFQYACGNVLYARFPNHASEFPNYQEGDNVIHTEYSPGYAAQLHREALAAFDAVEETLDGIEQRLRAFKADFAKKDKRWKFQEKREKVKQLRAEGKIQ